MFTNNFQLSDGDKNKGTVYLPDRESKNIPVIIYCHGWSSNRQLDGITEKLCEETIRANIAFVTFDFYGCGETGGNYSLMTYARWKNNLSDVISWCVTQPFADVNKIGCYACSSGTTAALRLAMEDDRIAFIISVATCISSHILMGDGGPAKLFADNLDDLISGGTVKMAGVDFGIDFYLDNISNAPIYSMNKINCPVLFLQGTADTVYRCADAKMAYELMLKYNPQTKSSYIPVEGGNHGLDNAADEAAEKILKWIMPIILNRRL